MWLEIVKVCQNLGAKFRFVTMKIILPSNLKLVFLEFKIAIYYAHMIKYPLLISSKKSNVFPKALEKTFLIGF